MDIYEEVLPLADVVEIYPEEIELLPFEETDEEDYCPVDCCADCTCCPMSMYPDY